MRGFVFIFSRNIHKMSTAKFTPFISVKILLAFVFAGILRSSGATHDLSVVGSTYEIKEE